jgi:hypothetical protein
MRTDGSEFQHLAGSRHSFPFRDGDSIFERNLGQHPAARMRQDQEDAHDAHLLCRLCCTATQVQGAPSTGRPRDSESCELTPRLMPRAQRLSQPAWRRSGRPNSQPRSACRTQTVPKPGYARAQEGAARSDPHCAGCEPVPGSCAFSPVSLIARHVTPVPCLAARP